MLSARDRSAFPFSNFYFRLSNLSANAPRAFTLLELLVVIAIIAIALGFLIPSLGTGQGRSAEAAARQLSADLDGARLMAIAERTRTRVL